MTNPQAPPCDEGIIRSVRTDAPGVVGRKNWILIATVIIIGTVGGVAAVRNALILEYKEMIESICKMSIGP